jgi:hypothetical protein
MTESDVSGSGRGILAGMTVALEGRPFRARERRSSRTVQVEQVGSFNRATRERNETHEALLV